MNARIESRTIRYDGKYNPKGGTLALLRHGTSEGNVDERWTGRKDVDLAKKGYDDAVAVADMIAEHNIIFDGIYTSELRRSKNTGRSIETVLVGTPLYVARNILEIPTIATPALNERDFGIYTWWRRDDVIAKVGEEEYLRLRRSRDARIEEGESIEDVHKRVRPIMRGEIVKRVKAGENILVVAHSNVVRVALADMHELPPGETSETLVVRNREAHLLNINKRGRVLDHEILREQKIPSHILYHEEHAS